VRVGRELQLVFQGLVGFAQPVGGENNIQGGDDGPAQAGHQLHPLPAGLAVPGVVVGGLDQVLRTGEGDFAVDHHDLAVVAQVRAAPLAVDGQQREHPLPLDLARPKPFEQVPVALHAEGTDVVKQHPDFHTTLGGFLQGGHEVVRDVVRAHDVELGVDELLRFPDGLGHLKDRVRVPRDQVHRVAVHHGQRAQPPVQLCCGPHPFRARVGALDVGQRGNTGPHPFIDLLLLLPPAAGQLEVAEQQEEDDADERDKENAQQPSHCGSGPPVARDNAHGEHPDHQVGDSEQHHHPRRRGAGKRKWP
jgi:hypothetical protein